MHANHSDDLSALERRLSSWEPASTGLDPDAVLFAAGRASVHAGRARFVWPALTLCLILLSIALGVRLMDERRERLVLAERLRHPTAIAVPDAPPSSVPGPGDRPLGDDPPSDSFLAAHRALEKGLDAWPMRAVVRAETPRDTSPVLQVGTRDALLDP